MTEIVLRQILTVIVVQVGAEVILKKKVVKYLGVRLDSKLSYWEQIKYAADKTGHVTIKLSRLMANGGGPTSSKRQLLIVVMESIPLYGCEIWPNALKMEK